MNTSQLTRRMMLPAMFLGLAGFSQAAPGHSQQRRGPSARSLHVVARAARTHKMVSVHTAIRGVRTSVRLPMMKFYRGRRTATVRHREGRYLYVVTGKLAGSRVHVTVRKYHGRRPIAQGSTVARLRGTTPRPTTYIVSRYHPITGKHIHTQRFDNRAAAAKWYRHNQQLWWVFVYKGFSKKPVKEYRGTESVCKKTAAKFNLNILDGKRAKAMPPKITFKTSHR